MFLSFNPRVATRGQMRGDVFIIRFSFNPRVAMWGQMRGDVFVLFLLFVFSLIPA